MVDHWVLGFVQSYTFAPNDFILKEDGVCRLHPQLARKVTQLPEGDVKLQAVVSKVREEVKVMQSASGQLVY
jgi:hypothetical protein